jgi:hypothetical protein
MSLSPHRTGHPRFSVYNYAQIQETLISVCTNTGDYEQAIAIGGHLNEMLDTTSVHNSGMVYFRAAAWPSRPTTIDGKEKKLQNGWKMAPSRGMKPHNSTSTA